MVEIGAVPQEGVTDTGGTHVLLGVPVVPGEGEGGIRSGVQEGEVHDTLDAGSHRGVYGGCVAQHPIGGLAGGDHEQDPRTAQRSPHGFRVLVGGLGDLGPG